MKKFLFFISVFFVFSEVFSQCADTANIYSFVYDGRSYEIVKEMKTWEEAAACAVERGGALVSINDSSEQNAVYDAIVNGAQIPADYTVVYDAGNIAYVWIGATDQSEEGTWLWDTNNDSTGVHFWTGQGENGDGNGTPVENAYTNWGGSSQGIAQEPDDYGTQDHAAIGLQGWPNGTDMLGCAGEWNDILGANNLYYIIEYDYLLGTDHETNQNNFRIFPNPCDGVLKISGDYDKLQIYDMAGKQIDEYEKAERINLSGIGTGLYFLQIEKGRKIMKQKLLIK